MTTYIEYELEDGSTILIESTEEESGLIPVSAVDGISIRKAREKLEQSLAAIKPWAAALRQQLHDLRADEVEVTFGLKAIGEAGNFAVGKVGAEANYEVKLKWVNKTDK